MAIHCISIIYSPSSHMDNYIGSWLTSWTAWTEEELDNPGSMQFSNIDGDNTVDASGFQQNRFLFEGVESENRSPERDAKYIVSNLTGITGYLASYCDWWVIRWHQCFHDENKGCTSWKVLDSSDSYSEFQNVPSEVPQ